MCRILRLFLKSFKGNFLERFVLKICTDRTPGISHSMLADTESFNKYVIYFVFFYLQNNLCNVNFFIRIL